MFDYIKAAVVATWEAVLDFGYYAFIGVAVSFGVLTGASIYIKYFFL